MKKRKAGKYILIALAGVTAAVPTVELFYYPRYVRDKKLLTLQAPAPSDTVTVVSANARCWSPTDLFQRSWFYRACLLIETVAAESPDVIGFQEVTPMHERFLNAVLSGYGHVLQYRDKSPLSEACLLYYSLARFEAADTGSFWLSDTPDEMSKYEGAGYHRVCTWALLRDRTTGKETLYMNTHLDNVSDDARIKGINVILEKLSAFGDVPVVLMGDLNTGEQGKTYLAATAAFDDAKYLAPETEAGATFQGFGTRSGGQNIDYFMVSKTGVEPLLYRILRTTYDGAYPSDHYPIALTLR
ncbi:MAG: endonuclease/exonuclease/phosphatase family protein [Clostridia bacterium]|nr:endonuclease/exonuclease/phosphatase family protein [Clostridia bacterium]